MPDSENPTQPQPAFKSFGCVQFDVHHNPPNQWTPQVGSGWASEEGLPARRITGIKDLSEHTLWLTNLPQDVFYKSNLSVYRFLKDSRYLRTSVDQIVREVGINAKAVGPAHSTEGLAEEFSRIMRLAVEHYQIKIESGALIQDLTNALEIKDPPYEDSLLDDAFAGSYLDRVECIPIKDIPESERWLTLRRPRLIHAQQIIGKGFMIPNGPWRFIGEQDMPPKEERMEWLETSFKGIPFMVKIKKMDFFKSLETEHFKPSKLLNLGESLLPGRQRRQRTWVPMPELLYLSRFASVEFDSVCVGEYYDDMREDIMPELHYMMHHSYAWGILAENVWMAYGSRSVNPKSKNKTLISPRAAWIRAIDRFYCFSSAQQMSLPQTKVLSYGTGNITISCKESDLGSVIESAVAGGLQAPMSSYKHWSNWEEKERKALSNFKSEQVV